MRNIYQQLLESLESESPLALVTVTTTTGSTPQKPGSGALMGIAKLIAGTIGGGAVEGKIQEMVNHTLPTLHSGHYYFDLDNDISHQDRGICGGAISVLVDTQPSSHLGVFEQMKESINQMEAGILITRVESLPHDLVNIRRFWATAAEKGALPHQISACVETVIAELLAGGQSGIYDEIRVEIEKPEVRYFFETVFPPPQLIIAGAGHIGRALSHLGSLLDFHVVMIDDRPEHANTFNLPDADQIIIEDIGKALKNIPKRPDTYIVIVTRGHKDDADALKACIGHEVAYLGMIGSRKKVGLMRNKFIEEGLATPEQWEAIHAPIGIEIGSQTVQEIAISIAAQLIQKRNEQITRS